MSRSQPWAVRRAQSLEDPASGCLPTGAGVLGAFILQLTHLGWGPGGLDSALRWRVLVCVPASVCVHVRVCVFLWGMCLCLVMS